MNRRARPRSRRRNRGSVLVVALIFAAVIAISLSSFLRLAVGTSKLANRSFHLNAARDLVDVGLEHALLSLNNNNWTTSTGFTPRGGFTGQYQGTFPAAEPYYYLLSGGVKGRVKVWVDTTYAVGGVTTPHAVAEASIILGDGSIVTREAEIYIKPRSIAEQPLVARSGLILNGNIYADSWDSMSDTPSTADDIVYSTTVRRAE